MDLQWQNVVNDMAKHLVVMESGASTNEDLDVVVEQLEMLAQRIRKNNGEVQELQKENEKMAKQLEETQKQLTNQVEKALYEKNQRISREKMCQLKTIITILEDEKETSEVLAKVQKRNLHLEVQLTHDKSNHEKLLKEIEKKIKQLHQRFPKSQTQEELVIKELEMVKEGGKEGRIETLSRDYHKG